MREGRVVTREEFFEWLETCPSDKWNITEDDFGSTSITFSYEEVNDDGGDE